MHTDERTPVHITPSALRAVWRAAPWWERVIYVLAMLLTALVVLLQQLTDHFPAVWRWEMNPRFGDLGIYLELVWFPVFLAAVVFGLGRQAPSSWRDLWQLWSMRMILIGSSVLYAYLVWYWGIQPLLFGPDAFLPHLPTLADVPLFAGCALLLVGMLLAAPELIVRTVRAKRAQGMEGPQP
jgi:hypothetical protein